MRKILLIITTALMAVSFVGCNEKVPVIPEPIEEVVEEKDEEVDADVEEVEDIVEVVEEIPESMTEEFIRDFYEGNEELYSLNEKFFKKTLPEMSIVTLDGESSNLDSFKGEPFIIEFMASWCPVCKEVKPSIEEYKILDGSIPVVSIGVHDDLSNLTNFAGDSDNYFLAEDSEALLEDFSLSFVPIFFFVDDLGAIKFIYSGEVTPEVLTELTSMVVK